MHRVSSQKRRERTAPQDAHARAQARQCAAGRAPPASARISSSKALFRDRRPRQPQPTSFTYSTSTADTPILACRQRGALGDAHHQTFAFRGTCAHDDSLTPVLSLFGGDNRRPVSVS